MRRLAHRVEKEFYVTEKYIKVPSRILQAGDIWRGLTLFCKGLQALKRKVRTVVGK